MILGVSELLRLVKEKKLVENLSQRELTNPEGAGFDLRIGELHRVTGKGFLGVTDRETASVEPVGVFSEKAPTTVTLEPNVYYIMKTVEKVNTPNDLAVLFRPRSTLFRSGVTLFTGACATGYAGELFFGMINLHHQPFTLEMGARVCHATFYQVTGDSAMYREQWQGGRKTTDGREMQV